jgi:starch synthase
VKILFITPEVDPIVKVGGLADVVGALPKALALRGHDVRLVCPMYGSIKKEEGWVCHTTPLKVRMGFGDMYARVWETKLPGTEVQAFFIEHCDLFGRPEVYAGPWGDHKDNGERFAFLSQAGLQLSYWMGWIPDVVHAHDWATALVPVILNSLSEFDPLSHTASVLTIHNLEHQGYCDKSILPWVGLPMSLFRADGLESMGAVNMLKGGIYHATKITTVSPTYAQEIQTMEGGAGLDHVLRFRSADLIGVLNGIDMDVWNPATDPFLEENYSADHMEGKQACKKVLCERFGLNYDPKVPVFGVVSRLFDQKGLDLLSGIVDRLMAEMNIQIVVLGTGESGLEASFSYFSDCYAGRFGTWIGFSNRRAHEIYAGCDFFLMPSRFEPCGLGQLYAMRYGTLPVVRSTGGLADTVEQYDEDTGKGNGFRFSLATPDALYYTIGWACATYYDAPDDYRKLQEQGMKKDFSWGHSADAYERVYRWSVEHRRGVV